MARYRDKEVREWVESIKREIELEDQLHARKEIENYLKMGIWERIDHPVFQKGVYYGAISSFLLFVVLFFVLGPIIFKP